jgi:hypothetical protein
MSYSDIPHEIKNFFPESEYNIVIEYSVIKISKKDPVLDCIQFKIMNEHIYITSLNRCGEISGTILLDNIYKLAQKLPNIKNIQLYDESYILKCNKRISLATIKILTTGQSWYNKLEYTSKNIKNELISNKKIIDEPYIDFITKIPNLLIISYEKEYLKNIESNKKSLKRINEDLTRSVTQRKALDDKVDPYSILEKELLDEDIERYKKRIIEIETYKKNYEVAIAEEEAIILKLIEDSKRLFPVVLQDNITVQECFNSIWSTINTNIKTKDCKNVELRKQCKWLFKFINMIEMRHILTYDRNLEKEVIPESTIAIQNKYLKYKNKYLNLKNQLGVK